MRSSRPYLWLLTASILGWSIAAYAERNEPGDVARSDARYSVATDGDRALLLDTVSGKTWLLVESPMENEPPAWLPVERIDDAAEAHRWRQGGRSEIAEDENKLDDYRSQLAAMQKRYLPSNGRIQELQEQIARLEERIEQQASAAKEQLKSAFSQQLYPLLLQEMELLQHHGEDHPEVRAIKRKIELTRELLKEQLTDDEDQ